MSTSLRISDVLFQSATSVGDLLSRSAAQHVEHWARLGRALEASGLTIDSAARLLGERATESEASLWRRKRSRQKEDLACVEGGRARQEDAYLFTPALARGAKVLNGPY